MQKKLWLAAALAAAVCAAARAEYPTFHSISYPLQLR